LTAAEDNQIAKEEAKAAADLAREQAEFDAFQTEYNTLRAQYEVLAGKENAGTATPAELAEITELERRYNEDAAKFDAMEVNRQNLMKESEAKNLNKNQNLKNKAATAVEEAKAEVKKMQTKVDNHAKNITAAQKLIDKLTADVTRSAGDATKQAEFQALLNKANTEKGDLAYATNIYAADLTNAKTRETLRNTELTAANTAFTAAKAVVDARKLADKEVERQGIIDTFYDKEFQFNEAQAALDDMLAGFTEEQLSNLSADQQAIREDFEAAVGEARMAYDAASLSMDDVNKAEAAANKAAAREALMEERALRQVVRDEELENLKYGVKAFDEDIEYYNSLETDIKVSLEFDLSTEERDELLGQLSEFRLAKMDFKAQRDAKQAEYDEMKESHNRERAAEAQADEVGALKDAEDAAFNEIYSDAVREFQKFTEEMKTTEDRLATKR
jgi:hypothetical protein